MIVTRAKVLGHCMGVRRAVELALKTAASGGAKPVYTLGPLIHNPQAVAELEAAGVFALGEAELDARVTGKTVIIRAHGVPPETLTRLSELGAEVLDATCPRVLASQKKARDFSRKGYRVVIAGDPNHGEVTGIAGYAPGAAVLAHPEDAETLEPGKPIALIAQTTIKKEEYAAIRDAIARRFPAIEVVDSICPATADRQAALAELAATCEAVVVVGGRNSANTTRLHSSALQLGKPAWLVETAAELPQEVFGFAKVGLTAGASTPEARIAEVEAALLAGPQPPRPR